MGLLGKIIKRQSAEDSEDLDFDDEMVDSLDMPGEEGDRRRNDNPEDTEGREDEDPPMRRTPPMIKTSLRPRRTHPPRW